MTVPVVALRRCVCDAVIYRAPDSEVWRHVVGGSEFCYPDLAHVWPWGEFLARPESTAPRHKPAARGVVHNG